MSLSIFTPFTMPANDVTPPTTAQCGEVVAAIYDEADRHGLSPSRTTDLVARALAHIMARTPPAEDLTAPRERSACSS